MSVLVSNADRVVFPEVGLTKGDVVAYYERIAPRLLPHVEGRPVSLKRFPKGLAAPGFFQKNVPAHYPETIGRFEVPRRPSSGSATRRHPRSAAKPAKGRGEGAGADGDAAAAEAEGKASAKGKRKATANAAKEPEDVTVYPLVGEAEHLAYLANQGALELHVPTARASDIVHPDRFILDLDPPEGEVALVRRAALVVRDALAALGLASAAVATGSKGFHVVAPIAPSVDVMALAETAQKLGALLAARHPAELTDAFRIANRGGRVFVDWLRNRALATVVAPYSLRARARATVATPLAWHEVETTAPDAFTAADLERLLDRPDALAALAPSDPEPFVAAVARDFEAAGLALEPFDRFRSG